MQIWFLIDSPSIPIPHYLLCSNYGSPRRLKKSFLSDHIIIVVIVRKWNWPRRQ